MSKTIIVSNRLPVKIAKEGKGRYQLKVSEGGLATGLGSIYKQKNNIWIGWSGLEIEEEKDQQKVTAKLKKQNLSPVFLTEREIQLYYEGFSNETLWPICHYMSTYAEYKQEYWDEYRAVNEKFRDAVIAQAEPGDIIWIHDYQLLLLPQLIREALPDSTIGFFQHIPFPSFEIFRLIPWRAELIEGMLGADLIGFHTYDDVRHFTSSATRILPIGSAANVLMKDDRSISVDAFPMGIDYNKFEKLSHAARVQKNLDELDDVIEDDTKIILSIDRLDYSKGIIQRLMAFDKVLAENPEYIEKVSMEMVVVPSRDQIPQYRQLKDEIDKWVGNINAHYRTARWHPIHYFYRSFPIENLSALYVKSDICLVTPMRDGMNLVSKEYVASRRDDDGVLILSEMAGASKELTDAIIVNPNNLGEMYRAIIQALEMPVDEQQSRMRNLKSIVQKFDINHWVKIFMEQLHEVKQLEISRQTKHAGAALAQKFVEQKTEAKNAVIFLDYDGTLVGFKSDVDKASPDPELYKLLAALQKKKNTRVVIISGRKHETLEEWFGHLPYDLIAEHGAWTRKNEQWVTLPGLTDKWKKKVRKMLETYSDRTPGSFIEEKKYSLVWHYRKVETGLGDMRANELISNLRYMLRGKRLQVLPGNKVVEIKNSDINKGKAASSFIYNQNFDFILAMGDDHTDEDIFTALPETAVTVKVGSSHSAAKYYLRSVDEVRELLNTLT